MKTKIACPRDRVEEIFRSLLSKEFTFDFCYRVDCVFVVPHIPPAAMQTILRRELPLSRAVELCKFSEA